MLRDKLKRQYSKLTTLQETKLNSLCQTANIYGNKKATQKNKCPKFYKKVFGDSMHNSKQKRQSKQNRPSCRVGQKGVLVNQFMYTEQSDEQKINKKEKNKNKNKSKCNSNEKKKEDLQAQYLKIVQKIYEDFNDQHLGTQIQQRINKSIPETAKYFLGSVLQLSKAKNAKISYLKFIGECNSIFEKSASNDIKQFVQIMRKGNRLDQTIKNQKKQGLKEIDLNLLQQYGQKNRQKQSQKQKSKEKEKEKQIQENKSLKRCKSGQIIQQSIVKVLQVKENKQNKQNKENILKREITNKDKLNQFITQLELQTFRQPQSLPSQKQIIKPLQQQEKNKSKNKQKSRMDRIQRNGYETPILKIAQGSPIKKIDQINKTISKCLSKDISHLQKQVPHPTKQDELLNTSTNSIFNHISSNMKNINQALHKLTVPFPKQLNTKNQAYSPLVYSSKTTRNVTPKHHPAEFSSNKFIETINVKYRIDSNPSQKKYVPGIVNKENYRDTAIKSYTMDLKSNKNKSELNGDRIDHLTNKVEEHIRRYAEKIEKTINARNLLAQ